MTSRLIVNSIRHTGASADAITLDNSGNATFPANVTCSGTASGFGGRIQDNLIINGAMQVAQRGTSSTSSGMQTVDRFFSYHNGTDEASTQAQVDVASGTTPYTLGFRKAYKTTNGNQTSGAGATDYIWIQTKLEAQDIANSGWNYTSTSSFVTLSFWVKSSVAQDFKGYLRSRDGTSQMYPFATGSLSADTWTKITKTIPGNSNLQFDNDVNNGLEINILPFAGTDLTNNATTEDAWAAYVAANRTKDNTSTWYTTNDATFEITGVQLEVGNSASDFQHRSFQDELAKCQRYYYRYQVPSSSSWVWMGQSNGSDKIWGKISDFPVLMRATPTCTISSGGAWFPIGANSSVGGHSTFTTFNFNQTTTEKLFGTWSGAAGIDTDAVVVFANTVTDYFDASAEL